MELLAGIGLAEIDLDFGVRPRCAGIQCWPWPGLGAGKWERPIFARTGNEILAGTGPVPGFHN